MDGGEGERERSEEWTWMETLRGARAKTSPGLADLYKWNVLHGFTKFIVYSRSRSASAHIEELVPMDEWV